VADPRHPPQPAGPPFERWVAARASALTRFAYVLTGSLDEADAVVQRVLASAYLHWHRLGADELVDTRLQTMVVRSQLRRRRRSGGAGHHRLPVPPGEGPWPSPARAGGEPDAATLEVWERCADLSPRQRAVLVLRCYCGMGTAETAATIRSRRATVAADLDFALAAVAPGQAAVGGARAREARRALLEYAETAPQAVAPADRAVVRAARTRRRRMVTAGTAAAALVVPAAWVWVADRPAPAETEPQAVLRLDPPAVDTSGWRWESWGGVQVQVPAEWGHADLTQWCVSGGPVGPAVDRPELVGTQALCSLHDDGRATYTGGLLLRRAQDGLRLSRADVAPYATTRIHTIGDITLTVVDIDSETGSAILASAEQVGRRDFNGCRPRRDRVGPTLSVNRSPGGPLTRIGTVESVSVCRYGIPGWPRPTLISSRRLTGRAASSALASLRAAPAAPPSSSRGRCEAPAREFAVLELWPAEDEARSVGSTGPVPVVVRYDGCRGHGVDDGLSSRALTAAVLEPILVPPWSGDLAADVRRTLKGE
jgi:DNA-directed RNA polymerase specialized sigma24 family protein